MELAAVQDYVSQNIGSFHSRRLKSLQELRLDKVLKRKNPYLFKAKNVLQAQDLVKLLLDAHLSSQEEAIFGELGMHFTQVATVTGILAWSVTCVIHHLSIWNGVHACRLLQEAVE